MGRKLVRDFVPGIRLAGEGPINGTIRTADEDDERALLGAEKVVEEAKELLEAVKDELAEHHILPGNCVKSIHRELGDVLGALQYTASICGVDVLHAAESKAKTHGKFTQHFVWEWPDDEQPRTISKEDKHRHDPDNPDCAWNYPLPAVKGAQCSCPGDEQPRTIGEDERKHMLTNAACPLNQVDILDSRGECTCPVTGDHHGDHHDPQNSDCPWNCRMDAKGIMECTCP